MIQLIATNEEGYTTQEVQYPVQNGKIQITLAPFAAVVLKYCR